MHRRGFLRALAGVLVAAPAATALVLRAPQNLEKFRPPRPAIDGDDVVARILAFEFLRILNHELEGIERQDPPCLLRTPQSYDRWEWTSLQHVGVNVEWKPELPFEQLCKRYVHPAARSVAEHLLDERQRGGRGLQFLQLAEAHGPTICEIVSAPQLSARMCVATWPHLNDDQEFELVTFARFDVAYWWDKRPQRPRRRFALDPARLPA